MDVTPSAHSAAVQRARILDKSFDLFRQHGIKAVTMDSIAHALSVSKRTIYQMFSDKETLLVEAMQRAREAEREEMERITEMSSNVLEILLISLERRMQDIESMNLVFFQDVLKYERVIRYLDDCERADADSAVEFLQRGVEQGFFRDDVDLRLFFWLISAQVKQIVGYHVNNGHNLRHLFLNSIPVSLRGLATPEGQRLIDAFVKKYPRSTPPAPADR